MKLRYGTDLRIFRIYIKLLVAGNVRISQRGLGQDDRVSLVARNRNINIGRIHFLKRQNYL